MPVGDGGFYESQGLKYAGLRCSAAVKISEGQNIHAGWRPAQKIGGGPQETVYASTRMSFPITCTACHKTFTISDEMTKPPAVKF